MKLQFRHQPFQKHEEIGLGRFLGVNEKDK